MLLAIFLYLINNISTQLIFAPFTPREMLEFGVFGYMFLDLKCFEFCMLNLLYYIYILTTHFNFQYYNV